MFRFLTLCTITAESTVWYLLQTLYRIVIKGFFLIKTRRFFITRLKFLGDVILTLPAVRLIRQKYPEAHITYLAARPFDELLAHHPDIDRVMGFNLSSIPRQLEVLMKLAAAPFDAALDLFGNPRTAMLCMLTGAKVRIGGDFRGRRLLYTHRINMDGKEVTAPAFHMHYLEPLGIKPQPVLPRLYVSDEEKERAARYLSDLGYTDKPIVGIHAGATWPAKMWRSDRFAELAKRLSKEHGVQVFFTAGPADLERVNRISEQASVSPSEPRVVGIRQLCALVQKFSLFISNDCGPMHIAPALSVPTLGIFGPGQPHIWFPYRTEDGHHIIHKHIECSRCGRDFCDDLRCMDAISVADVFDMAVRVLRDTKKI